MKIVARWFVSLFALMLLSSATVSAEPVPPALWTEFRCLKDTAALERLLQKTYPEATVDDEGEFILLPKDRTSDLRLKFNPVACKTDLWTYIIVEIKPVTRQKPNSPSRTKPKGS